MRGHIGCGFCGPMPPPPYFGPHYCPESDKFGHHGPFGRHGYPGHHSHSFGHGPHHGPHPHGPHHHGPHHHGPHHHGPHHHGPHQHDSFGYGLFGFGPSFGPGHHKQFEHCRLRPYDRPGRGGRHFPSPCCGNDDIKCGRPEREGRSTSPPCCKDDSGLERCRSRSRGRKSRPRCPRNRDRNPETEDTCNEATDNGPRCGYGNARPCHSV